MTAGQQVTSIDPRSGAVVEVAGPETAPADVAATCDAAAAAAPALEAMGRAARAAMLLRAADALERGGGEVVALTDRETALGSTRLTGELARTCFQLRLFADVLEDGGYLEAALDHAGATAMGPRPDLRRMLIPLGPVAVFGSSNFPLAFSVPGGDTVSALAAGCPVVVKAHPSHPATAQLCFEILRDSLASSGAPESTLALVHGLDAGAQLVGHPSIRAVAFTGSTSGGQALMRLIQQRPEPIPFYGELSSLNPVVVSRAAARERADELGRGLVASFTLGSGQFCTKPGLIFVPSDEAGDRVVAAMSDATAALPQQHLLNAGIARAFTDGTRRLGSLPGVDLVASAGAGPSDGYVGKPLLLSVPAREATAEVMQECFGPVAVLVRYATYDELVDALRQVPPSLTATLHTGTGDEDLAAQVTGTLRGRSGRLVFNGYPTGVAVSWAQHHGGPWPATNTVHTSVGATAIRRFLRPMAWQDAPEHLLPLELRDGAVDVPRRVDGVPVPRSAT